jgi:hypothetical protein
MTVIWLFLQLYFFPGVYSVHFYTPEGFALVRKILLGVLPTFEPHSYQIDGVCKVLDEINLVVWLMYGVTPDSGVSISTKPKPVYWSACGVTGGENSNCHGILL